MQGEELDTFFLGVLHLFEAGRHLGFRTAIDNHHPFRTQAFGRAAGVHGRVATAHYHDILGQMDRGVRIRIRGVHEVDARQVLVARHDVDTVLARNTHEVRQSCAGTYEDAFEALVLQFLHADGFAHETVFFELHADFLQVLNLHVHNLVGQTELRNAVFQYAADFMQGFEHRHVIPVFGHVAGE